MDKKTDRSPVLKLHKLTEEELDKLQMRRNYDTSKSLRNFY